MNSPTGNVAPFRAKGREALIHHNNRGCPVGRLVDRADRRNGTGGQPLCGICATFIPRGDLLYREM
jgi:hypothetical protein